MVNKKKKVSRKRKTVVNLGKLLAAALAGSQVAPETTAVIIDPTRWGRFGFALALDLKTLPQNPLRVIKAALPFVGYGIFKGFVKWQDREIVSTNDFRVSV